MEFTPNMQLPVYERDDTTSWLGVYNNAMRIIDKDFGENKATTTSIGAYVQKAQDDIAELQTASSKHTQDIITNTTSINQLQTQVTNLEQRENQHYSALTGEVDALKTNQTNNQFDIDVLKRNLMVTRDMTAVNASSINKLQTRVLTLEDTVNDNQTNNDSRITKLESDMTKAQSDINDADSLARQASNTANAAMAQAASAVDKVAQTTVTVGLLQSQITEGKGDIAALYARTKNNSDNIQIMSTSVSKNTQDISNANTDINALEVRVTTLENAGGDTALTQRVDNLETWKQTADTNIQANATAAAAAQTTANNVQSQVINIKSGVTVPFSFGYDSNGNAGYYKAGADSVTPFNVKNELDLMGSVIESTVSLSQTQKGMINYNNSYVIVPKYYIDEFDIKYVTQYNNVSGSQSPINQDDIPEEVKNIINSISLGDVNVYTIPELPPGSHVVAIVNFNNTTLLHGIAWSPNEITCI